MKSLVIYFSRADENYFGGSLKYIQKGNTEIKNERPKLMNYLDDISKYDIIFVGSPIYWGTMPAPLFTQLEKLNFAGKIIMPFTTHEGSGLGSVVSEIKAITKGATVKQGLAIVGSSVNNSKSKVEKWINENF